MSHTRTFRRFAATAASVLAASGLMLGVALTLGTHSVFADDSNGDIRVHVTREADSALLVGASVTISCDGGVASAPVVTNGSGEVLFVEADIMNGTDSDCDDGDTATIVVSKDGYVTKTKATDIYASGAPNVFTVTNVLFGYKFTLDDEMTEDNAVSDAIAVMGASETLCISSGSTYYCATPVADSSVTVTVDKSGYVTQSFFMAVDRIADLDAQDFNADPKNFEHAVKVAVTDELENSLSGASVQTGDGSFIACNEDGISAMYYCAVPVVDSVTDVVVAKAGYVQKTAASDWTDRTASSTAQRIATTVAVKFAHRVYVEREGDVAALTGATVAAGTGVTACVEGTGGYYYCPVPVAQDGSASVQVSKTGYVTDNSAATIDDRTVATDPQAFATTTSIDFQLRVNLADELGTSVSGSVTYGGFGSDASNSNSYYFARALTGASVIASKTGFVNSNQTNTTLEDVSTGPGGQTTLNFGVHAANNAGSVTAGSDADFKGLAYKVKSLALRTETIGGLITDIVDHSYTTGNDPSADLSISASGGATISGSAVASNVIYLAITGDGGGDDTFTVKLSNVTADGGTSNGANFVTRSFTDAGNEISSGPGAAQKTFGADATVPDGTPDIDGNGFKYPLIVSIADELGNAFNVSDSAEGGMVYQGSAPYITDGADNAFFTNLGGEGGLTIQYAGFIPNATTNSGFSGFSINQDAQTTITLGNSAADASITAGAANPVKGLEYLLKSNILNSERGGTISSLADSSGYVLGSSPSADVTLGGTNGLTIIGAAVSGDVVYIAATANGATGGADTLTVQAQNVTVDGGTADSAALVKATFTDETNLLSVATTQQTFDAGVGESSADLATTALLYPLKVVIADQFGNALSNSLVTTKTFNGAARYTAFGSNLYWAQTGSHTLVLTANGFIPSGTTNGGYNAVNPSQNAQTVINLGNFGPSESIAADASNDILGLVYALRSGTMESELGDTIHSLESTVGFVACETDPCTLSADVIVASDSDTGAALIGGAVVGDVVYLAATGDGAANTDDLFALYPLNATLGSRLADSADMNAVFFIDTAHTVNTNAAQGVMNAGPEVGAGSLSDTTGYTFPLKVFLADELANDVNIAGIAALSYNGVSPYRTSTSGAYFANHGSSAPLVIHKDGYIAGETTNTGFSNVSTDAFEGPTVITMDDGAARTTPVVPNTSVTALGLRYGLKVTVQREGDNAALTGSDVRAGDSYGVTCSEDGSTGIHYCAVPLAQTGTSTRIIKDAYNTKYLNYTDRTGYTDGQGSLTAVLVSPGDITPPTVSSQTPTDDSVDIAVTTSPTIAFNEAMDPATLNGGTVKIKKYSDDSDVTATILYNPSTYTVTLDPDANLTFDTQYYLYISGARDVSGNAEVTDYSVGAKASHEFTTGSNTADVTAPSISAQTPADDAASVAVTVSPTITFDAAMDASTLNSANIKIRKYSDDSDVSATVLYDASAFRVTLVPVSSLSNSTQYYLYVSSTKDLAGNIQTVDYSEVAKSSHEFETAVSTADVTAPTVSSQTPVNGATSVALSVSPTVTFSEAMDASTLNGGTVQLRNSTTGSPVASVLLYNPVSHVLTLDPSTDLANSTYYHLWVSGAEDVAGNAVTDYVTTSSQRFLTTTDTTSLRVTGIDAVDTFATAGGGYDAGWSWDYYVTASSTQTSFKMRFSDFLGSTDSIAAATNIRFYSAQASASADADNAVTISAANTYSSAITLDGDLDPSTPGRQVKITVQMRVPVSAAGGSYSGSYGVQTTTPVL